MVICLQLDTASIILNPSPSFFSKIYDLLLLTEVSLNIETLACEYEALGNSFENLKEYANGMPKPRDIYADLRIHVPYYFTPP